MNTKIVKVLITLFAAVTVFVSVFAAPTSNNYTLRYQYKGELRNLYQPNTSWVADAPAVENAADLIYDELNLSQCSYLEKVFRIYEWLGVNVHYDFSYASNMEHSTLYNCLVLHRGVCEDFASAFYFLCYNAGITDVECIRGKNAGLSHKWNIVKYNNLWYVVDSSSGAYYDTGAFMISKTDAGYIWDSKFTDPAFLSAHPFATKKLERQSFDKRNEKPIALNTSILTCQAHCGSDYIDFNWSTIPDYIDAVYFVMSSDLNYWRMNMGVAERSGFVWDYINKNDPSYFSATLTYNSYEYDLEDGAKYFTIQPIGIDKNYQRYSFEKVYIPVNIRSGSHNYVIDSSQSTPVTCTQDGYSVKVCSVCGDVSITKIPKLNHKNKYYDSSKTVPATCTTAGKNVQVCPDCGEEFPETINALGHSWGAWTQIATPTFTTKGREARYCSRCNTKETRDTNYVNGYDSKNGYYYKDGQKQKNVFILVNDELCYFNESGKRDYREGIVKINNKGYFLKDGVVLRNQFITAQVEIGNTGIFSKQTIYAENDGSLATGLHTINNKLYYFEDSYAMATLAWKTVNGKTYYFNQEGSPVIYRHKIGGKWYYFNGAGVLQYGWIGNKAFYAYNDGTLATGVVTIDGIEYEFDENGSFVKQITQTSTAKNGWLKENGKWRYYTNNVAAKGWKKVSNKWYWFDANANMATGWKKISNKWYFFNASGAMVTGWLKSGSAWYYFNSSGAMVTGWQKIGSKWYYFNNSGSMRTANLKQGGKTYRFNSSGACLNP